MRIAIYTKQNNAEVLAIAKHIIAECNQLNIDVSMNEKLAAFAEIQIESFNEQNLDADFLISVGGDGTLLDTVLYVKNKNIPVLGINTGRMGFLATMTKDDIGLIIKYLSKRSYTIEKRSLLFLESNHHLFGENNIALNDFVVHKKETSSMITVHAYLNGDYLNSYWADGLIVCTPTGSTGYSLSCGGPIIFPASNSFAISPISPHHLNVRPVIVPDNSVVSFEVDSRGSNFLISLDSRSLTVDSNIQIAVRKSDDFFNVINLKDKSYIETLRKKMGWGVDYRN